MVLILSGKNRVPISKSRKKCHELIRENIQRNIFDKFMQHIFVTDPTNIPDQRAQKLVCGGGYFSKLRKKFSSNCGGGGWGRMDCHWVHYRVIWDLWQFSKAVSSLETYTVWVQGVVCKSSFPVPLWFWIYKGSTSRKTDLVKNFGLGAWVVLDQVDSVLNGEDGNHLISVIEVNNFFKSFRFIEECSKRNLLILGH